MSQRREGERLRQEEQKACLAEAMSDGSKLRDWMPADRTQGEIWNKQYDGCAAATRSNIEKAFSAADASRLFAIKGTIDRVTTFHGGGVHQNNHAQLCDIVKELNTMFINL
jgi:hypothetical protein